MDKTKQISNIHRFVTQAFADIIVEENHFIGSFHRDQFLCVLIRAVKDYYLRTFKDIDKHSNKQSNLGDANIDEVIVIGHCLMAWIYLILKKSIN